jgi:1-phosphatidylinositol-3-phosphate 5-kinase
LDENLLEEMKDGRALLVDPLSKALLNMAVWNDTLFLARLHVMDYSLLVGVCAGEYVVGVIDYIRRYTWDKQLETLLKQSGMAGGQRGKIPTVIKPPAYKERFRQAMDAFFIVIPNDVQMPQRVMQLQSLQSQQQLEQLDVTEDDVAPEEFDALLPANS